jgi:outer membrane immunogenic protein
MITKTKLLLLGTVFSLGATSLSFAADLPRKAPAAAPVYPPPVATWAGCYIGGTVGVVNNRVSGNVDFEGFSTGASGNKTGGIYGGYLGCNLQSNNFVYGIEGDFSGISGSGASRGFTGVVSTGVVTSKPDWLSTIRGRAGLAFNNAMVYLTGGVAFADIKNSAFLPGFPEVSASNTRVGWTIGAGGEYMFTPNWVGRLEFLYADLGSHSATYPVGAFGATSSLSHELLIGRVGLAYKW